MLGKLRYPWNFGHDVKQRQSLSFILANTLRTDFYYPFNLETFCMYEVNNLVIFQPENSKEKLNKNMRAK